MKKKPNQYEIRLPPTFQRGEQNELRTHQIERLLAVPGDEKFPLTGVQRRNCGLEVIVGHRIGGVADRSRPVLHAAESSHGVVRCTHSPATERRWSPAEGAGDHPSTRQGITHLSGGLVGLQRSP